MAVVKRLRGVEVRFGGEEHRGWLPPGAATPLPTPVRVVKLDFDIRQEGGGFFLEWSGPGAEDCGDTWHKSLEDAKDQAMLWFGIQPGDWDSV